MYAQALMLAMTANGLASVPKAPWDITQIWCALLGLGRVKVLFGISFGYEDTTMQVNNAITERAPLEDTVTFAS